MRLGDVLLSAVLCAATGFLLWQALSFAPNTREVPIIVLVPTLLLLLSQLVLDLRTAGRGQSETAPNGQESLRNREIAACTIVGAVVLGVDLLGLAIGVALGLMALLSLRARVGIPQAGLAAIATFVAVDTGFGRYLGLLLPEGRLWGWLGL